MIETEILIYGGGTSGTCAAIQAARRGANVIVIEPSKWIGGMITAAGVSALDGNKYGAGGGIVHEFRQALAEHYGSIESLYSGWVSLYCFEPVVAHRILSEWVEALPTLTVYREADVTGYRRAADREREVRVRFKDGSERTIRCRLFLDCTEYGDGLKLAGIPYTLGREGRDDLGESAAPAEPDDELQDLTYVATLKKNDASPTPTETISEVQRTYWKNFRCSTSEDCDTRDEHELHHPSHDWQSFISYATLPNDRFMLNWPFRSNDYPITPAFFENRFVRRHVIASARLHTLENVRYIQHSLGHPEWRLDLDQYPSGDGLALIPYIRETRRMRTARMMVQDDVVPQAGENRARFRSDAIAVGDYFLDHHHGRAFERTGERLVENLPDNGPFQVPISVFIPDSDVDDPCFLVGEKSISVSHIVNGCTRLQPVVMLMGQALGILAAEAIRRSCSPSDVPVRDVQQELIDAGAQLYVAYDVDCEHPLFRVVQELGMARILGNDDPLHLTLDEPVNGRDAARWADRAGLDWSIAEEASTRTAEDSKQTVSRGAFLRQIHEAVDLR